MDVQKIIQCKRGAEANIRSVSELVQQYAPVFSEENPQGAEDHDYREQFLCTEDNVKGITSDDTEDDIKSLKFFSYRR